MRRDAGLFTLVSPVCSKASPTKFSVRHMRRSKWQNWPLTGRAWLRLYSKTTGTTATRSFQVPFQEPRSVCLLATVRKRLDVGCVAVGGGLHMRKHTATARPANSDFAKTYLEVKRLREDIERIEKSLKRRRSHEQVADSAPPKDDPRTGDRSHF